MITLNLTLTEEEYDCLTSAMVLMNYDEDTTEQDHKVLQTLWAKITERK